tara:strand:+ start:457 stop:756 length:300 start_codon:yes stop_codon:yes gene_type:complete
MFAIIKKNYFILIFTILFLYFFFNFLDGDRGLISYFEKKSILNKLNQDKIELINKTNDLELKNSLMTNNLDLDYIEILIREKFFFNKEGDRIYLIKNED